MKTNRLTNMMLVAIPVLTLSGASALIAFGPASANESPKAPATTVLMENEQENPEVTHPEVDDDVANSTTVTDLMDAENGNPEVTYPDVEDDPATKALAGVLQIDSCGELGNQPAEITLACGDGNSVLTDLEWGNWGTEAAGATGNLVENNCDPDCATGTDETYPVVVTAEGIQEGEASARYTHLVIEFADKVPAGHDAIETIELPALD